MKKRNVTNKDLMKRLDHLERNNELMSGIFLLYSVAIALLLTYFSLKSLIFLALGVICYAFGMGLSIQIQLRKKLK